MKFRGLSIFLTVCVFFSSPLWTEHSESLLNLERQVRKDLEMINIPFKQWLIKNSENHLLDVAIVGGGMSGMASALALIKEGITRIKIFDENCSGEEGPWAKYARMNMLRSPKSDMGPAMGIPSLTFRAWYEAQYGQEAWLSLKSTPTHLWCGYLCWFRHVLRLPIENHMTLKKITPLEEIFELTFTNHEQQTFTYHARKIILATGREGCGGLEIPKFMTQVPKKFYAHTGEKIDPDFFCNKHIAIIGAGASAFDAAGLALEKGAASVDMLIRRKNIPTNHKFAQFYYPGIYHGFYLLSDEMRCQFFAEGMKYGNPPPKTATDRIKNYSNLTIHYGTQIENISHSAEKAIIHTNQGSFECDFIVCGTGYKMNLSHRQELEDFFDSILLWESHVPSHLLAEYPSLGQFPYLGTHFEFQGTANFLKNIHCFNTGSFLSHGMITGDIPSISLGATRLAQGIAADFFLKDQNAYFQKMLNTSP